jgi:methionine-rich copper-binding protein CopC
VGRWFIALTPACAIAFAVSIPAFAHGDLVRSEPSGGSKIARAPREVRLVLAEPPGPGSTLRVRDGCADRVVEEIVTSEEDSTLTARLARGEPGGWRVRFESVSAVDGHLVRGGFKFKVEGKRDCNDTKIARGANRQKPGPTDEDDSSLPLVPLAVGTAALVGIALVARRSTS